MCFAGVGGGVVEFPLSGARAGGGDAAVFGCGAVAAHEFPMALAHGFVAHTFPEERAIHRQRGGFTAQGGQQARSFERLHRMTGKGGRMFRVGGFQAGGEHVHDVRGASYDFAALRGRDAGGPVRDEWRGGAAVVHPNLELAEGRVAHLPPARSAHFVGAVVAEEEDERVVELAAFSQRFDDAGEVLVHAVDHRGEMAHPLLVALLFGVLGFVGDFGVELRQARGIGDEADLLQTLETTLADGFGADAIGFRIFRNIALMRLQRPMWRGVGQIAEPRLSGVGFLDESQRVVGEAVGRVEVWRQFFDPLAVVHELCDGTLLLPRAVAGELLASAADEREMTLKAALARPAGLVLTEMPFSGHEGLIARLTQRLRQGHEALFFEAEIRWRADAPPQLIRRALFVHVAHARLMRIQPAHERGTRGAALRAVVEPCQPHATDCQRIERRRADFAAVAADVGVAHVIHHDEEDVGALFRSR